MNIFMFFKRKEQSQYKSCSKGPKKKTNVWVPACVFCGLSLQWNLWSIFSSVLSGHFPVNVFYAFVIFAALFHIFSYKIFVTISCHSLSSTLVYNDMAFPGPAICRWVHGGREGPGFPARLQTFQTPSVRSHRDHRFQPAELLWEIFCVALLPLVLWPKLSLEGFLFPALHSQALHQQKQTGQSSRTYRWALDLSALSFWNLLLGAFSDILCAFSLHPNLVTSAEAQLTLPLGY